MNDQWQFKEIDSSLFKAFVFAAKELNFTRAAKKAAMTQSGISQKISKLESQIGHPLFARVNKSLSLTDTGKILLDYVERQQDELEKLFEELGQRIQAKSGLVRYGMPHSCLFTPHFQQLLQARQANFFGISLKIELCSNEEIISKLLQRELDFGFVTKKSENPAIDHDLFVIEEYALVGEKGSRNLKTTADFICKLPFVNYPGMNNLFAIWKKGHFPAHRVLSFESLKIMGDINSLHGAVTMITHGVGWSVVPIHVVENELKSGIIQIFPGTEKKKIKNEIYVVLLRGHRQTARVKAVFENFRKMKKI